MNDFELQQLRNNKTVLLYLLKISVWLCIAPRYVITNSFIENMWVYVKSAQNIFDINMPIQDTYIHSAVKNSTEFHKNDVFHMFNVHTFGLNPRVTKNQWAYPIWYIIHAASIKTTSKKDFVQLLHSIPHIIPCDVCSTHSTKFLKENNVNEVPMNKLFEYTSNFHQESKSLEYLTDKENNNLKKIYKNLVPLYYDTQQVLSVP